MAIFTLGKKFYGITNKYQINSKHQNLSEKTALSKKQTGSSPNLYLNLT